MQFPVEECSCECASWDVAHLQAHEAREASESGSGTNSSEEISAGHLFVSYINNLIESSDNWSSFLKH